MSAIHVSSADFKEVVLNATEPVLVDFWASWCGPCQMLGPIVEAVSEEISDAKICKVDVDENQDLASEYGVMSIPTLILFKDGEVVKRSTGVISKSQIIALLND